MKVSLTLSEAAFQEQVVALAHLMGWEVNHTRRSIVREGRWATATSRAGFPDLTLWDPRAGGLVFAELKAQKGRLSADQKACIASLRAAGCDVRVWRPADWDEIEALLQRKG